MSFLETGDQNTAFEPAFVIPFPPFPVNKTPEL